MRNRQIRHLPVLAIFCGSLSRASEQGTERAETFGQNVQKSERVADKSVERVSLKECLAERQIRAADGGIEKRMPQKSKGTEVSM